MASLTYRKCFRVYSFQMINDSVRVGDCIYGINDYFISSTRAKGNGSAWMTIIQESDMCSLKLIRISSLVDHDFCIFQHVLIDDSISLTVQKSQIGNVSIVTAISLPSMQYIVGCVLCAVNETNTLLLSPATVQEILSLYRSPVVILVMCPVQKTVITESFIQCYMKPYINDIMHSDISRIVSALERKEDITELKKTYIENEGVDRFMFSRSTGYLLLEKQYQNYYNDLFVERDEQWKTYIEKVGGVANLSFSLTRQSGNRWKLINVTKQDKNREELRALIHSGIPERLRGEVWYHISGGFEKRASSASSASSTSFQTYYNSAIPSSVKTAIDQDLPRTFATHPLFHNQDMEAPYQLMLRHVLYGLAGLRPDIGYCQGLNYLGALLLLVQNDEEIAFWTLAAILEHLFPSGYFTDDSVGARVDEKVLEMLLERQSPELVAKLRALEEDIATYTQQWLLCLFINSLPFLSVVRVWDVIMFEGDKALLRIALALISVGEEQLLRCQHSAELSITFQRLGNLLFDVENLLNVAYQKDVAKGAKEKVIFFRRRELEKWRKEARRGL